MEKRKLLLVAISVGIFLVISIVAAILFFQPRNASPNTVTGVPVQGTVNYSAPPPSYQLPPAGNNQVDALNLVRNPSELPGLKPAPEGMTRQNSDYYVTGSGSGAETVISVPKPSSAAVPETAPAGKAIPVTKSTAPAPKPAVAKPAAPKPAAQASVAAPKPAAAQTKVYNDFWVQTGAFSTIAKAEGVKETLASKGITSIIENRDVNGSTLFRVRVGPYTSQNEANYWLSLIKSINGFEDSQIRQSQSRR